MDYPKKKSCKRYRDSSTAQQQHYEIFANINSARSSFANGGHEMMAEAISLPAYVQRACCRAYTETGNIWNDLILEDEKMFAFNDHFTFHITDSLKPFSVYMHGESVRLQMKIPPPKRPSQSTLSILIHLSNLCLFAHTEKKYLGSFSRLGL